MVAACSGSGNGTTAQHSARHQRGDLVAVRATAAPEGPQATAIKPGDTDWGRVQAALPIDLPTPLAQHGCTLGSVVTLVMRDRSTIDYGPCHRPDAIDHVRCIMINIHEDGCGSFR